MFDRYWNFTTCIRCDDLTAIEQALTSLLEQEKGCCRLSQLPPLVGSLEQLQAHHPWDQSCYPWMVSLFTGSESWTIVKTWPTELLCHKMANDSCSRLSALTIKLGCDAFHLGVYASYYGFLLETNADGCIHISGTFDPEIPTKQFYQQPIHTLGRIKQFSLLNVSEPMRMAMEVNQSPALQQRIAELERLAEKNPQLKYDFDWGCEVYQGYTERIDRALAGVMSSSDPWYLANLAYLAYAYPEELMTARAHLLYFRPPTNYKLPWAYTSTESLLWDEIFGSETNENFGLETLDD